MASASETPVERSTTVLAQKRMPNSRQTTRTVSTQDSQNSRGRRPSTDAVPGGRSARLRVAQAAMPTSRKSGATTNGQPTPTAMPRPMTTGTVTESSIETKVERVSWMRARTPPLAETAALTCPSSSPQPRPTPAAPTSVTPKAGAQAMSRAPSSETASPAKWTARIPKRWSSRWLNRLAAIMPTAMAEECRPACASDRARAAARKAVTAPTM